MKKGYIKLIAAVILGVAIIGGGIYGVYTLLSSNTTTILYRSTVDDKINAIRPYIVALPVADQLQAYYVERRFEKDNFKGSDELAAQYVPLAEQFYATYNALDLALDNRNNELYTERMTEYQGEKRENAVNFIELNLMTAQTIDLIDPDGNTDTQKVEANLQQITQRINKLQPGTTSETNYINKFHYYRFI